MALLAAATLSAEGPKCGGTARECEQQIRQLLAGRRYFGATVEYRNPGLVITSIKPNSPAARAGLLEGDQLIAVNGKSLTHASTREFKQILADARETGKLWMIISRNRVYKKLDAKLEPYTKEQIDKIVGAHLSQSHPSTAGAQH